MILEISGHLQKINVKKEISKVKKEIRKKEKKNCKFDAKTIKKIP